MRLHQMLPVGGLIASAALLGYLFAVMPSPRSAAAQSSPSGPPPVVAMAAALIVGLHPESLAVGQVTTGDLDAIMAQLTDAGDLRQALANQLAAATVASATAAALQAQVDAGLIDEPTMAALATALTADDESTAALAAIREQMFAAAIDGLAEIKIARLQAFRASARYRAPLVYRGVQRSDNDWLDIAIACRARDRAFRLGQPLAASLAQSLAAVEAEPEVIVAGTFVPSLLPQLESHVQGYVSPS